MVVIWSILLVISYIVLWIAEAWVFQMVWNYVMPYLFELPTITLEISFLIVLFLTYIGNKFKSNNSSKK